MRGLTLIAVAALAAAAVAIAQAGTSSRTTTASLRLVTTSPFVVRGAGFQPSERVRVKLSLRTTYVRTANANAAGGFTASFGSVPISRCSSFSVVAHGATSARTAVLKHIPLPMCMPA